MMPGHHFETFKDLAPEGTTFKPRVPPRARGEAQGRRREIRRDPGGGARGTHPDRVPHTDHFFFQALLGGFSCVLLFSSLLRS